MKKLIIMDHSTNEISIYNYDENIWYAPEYFHTDEDEQVFPIDGNTEWMLVNEVKINIH